MTLKNIEELLKMNNLYVKNFDTITKTSYSIILKDGGAIHLNNKCEITSIQGSKHTVSRLYKLFGIREINKRPKRWKIKMKKLEDKIICLEHKISKLEGSE